MWKKSGMAVAFKETGSWTSFSFVGTPGGVTTYCYWKSVAFSASGLFLAHLTVDGVAIAEGSQRSEAHTSELQSLMRISYAVFCLKKKKHTQLEHTQ